MFEFLVDSISPKGLVLGRNGSRNIPVGTTFTSVRLSRAQRGPSEINMEDLGEVATVAMTLREVHWYQRTIEHVPDGHTAGLAVSGNGLEVLAGLLRDLPKNDYLSLTAPASQDTQPNSASDGGK